MFELLKRALLGGLGLATVTKNNLQKLAGELVKKGELTEKEGKKLLNDLLEKSEKTKKEFHKQIETIVRRTIGSLDIASKKDIQSLEKKIERLGKKSSKKKIG